MISTLSGTGERTATPDSAALSGTPLLGPRSIDCDKDGNAYLVLREGNAVFKLDLDAGRCSALPEADSADIPVTASPVWTLRLTDPKGSPIPAPITACTSLTRKITSFVTFHSAQA